MPKMKWGNDIDWRGLDQAEYSDGEFDDYDGPLPPKNVILKGKVKKAWATESRNGDAMIKVLFEAADNTGDRKVYNGCPIWDNVLFTMPQVKFKWQPFLEAIGISLADIKNKTVTSGEEDNMGDPIVKIGTVKFGDGVPVRVKTDQENSAEYGKQVRVGRWLPAAEAEEADGEDDGDEWDDDEDDEDAPF